MDQLIVIYTCDSLSVVQKLPKIVCYNSYYKVPGVKSWVVSLYHAVYCGAPVHRAYGNI